MIGPKKEIEDLFLAKTGKCQTPIEQTQTKPE